MPVSSPDVMSALIHAAHVLEDRLELALDSVGLSTAKYGVLSQLAEAGPLPLSELAARQRCVRSNMTQLVDRLEAEGLVRRVDDPADRRIVLAELTSRGRELAAAGARQWGTVQSEFCESLSERDRAAIGRVLSALR